jgi:hypothetical protein
MMEGQQFVRSKTFFTIEQVAISYAQGEMHDGDPDMPLQEHEDTDAQEKNDLYQPEKKIYPWELPEDVLAGQYEHEDIEGDDQLAPEIKGMGLFATEMADGMGEDEDTCGQVQPGAAAFKPFEGRRDDR